MSLTTRRVFAGSRGVMGVTATRGAWPTRAFLEDGSLVSGCEAVQ